jgi:hypothetical protein
MIGSNVPLALRTMLCLAALGTMLATGCQREIAPIRQFDEPKPEYEMPLVETKAPERMSIWGVIAPMGNGQWWFFKLVGPTERVLEQKSQYAAFVDSLKYNTHAEWKWEWKLPSGWRQVEGDGTRIYTFEMGPDTKDQTEAIAAVGGPIAASVFAARAYPLIYPEMSLTLLGGSLLSNVNRWREQVGLRALEMAELQRTVQFRVIEGAGIFLVEMSGPSYNARPRMKFPHGAPGH